MHKNTEALRTIALIDCNNFYVSCERIFRPDLTNRPVIVLSNNDGCTISRSSEAKALGIKMGAPAFQLRDVIREHNIAVFSSNYVLYADISNRVMSLLLEFSPVHEIYSIDETFLDLTGFDDIDARAIAMRMQVYRDICIPVCVGMGATKTLAKLANFMAKNHPRSAGIFNFNHLSPAQINNVMQHIPVNEIWGIGKALTTTLNQLGINNVAQLRDADIAAMRNRFGVVLEKTIRELRGECCIALEQITPAKQQIINSRSFGQPITAIEDLQDALTHFVSNAAQKCREQNSVAGILQIFIQTDRFRKDRPHYCPSITLPLVMPTAHTITLQQQALAGLAQLYRPGFHYKKAGVILSEIRAASEHQGDLFATTLDNPALMTVMDTINQRYGKGMLRLSQDGSRHAWKTRQENKSPEYTTNWNELPNCK